MQHTCEIPGGDLEFVPHQLPLQMVLLGNFHFMQMYTSTPLRLGGKCFTFHSAAFDSFKLHFLSCDLELDFM